MFNFFGSRFYQFYKIILYTVYFMFKLRFTKLKMVYKGLNDSFKMKI